MKKREKCYQILSTNVEVSGSIITKTIIVYYDEFGVEITRETYSPSDIIKEGYIPFYLTLDVPTLYESLSDEIKNIYLTLITDETLLNDEGVLNVVGNEKLKTEIRTLYSKKISNIPNLQEFVERHIFDGTIIPQEVIDSRELLKTEYHNLISYLGL